MRAGERAWAVAPLGEAWARIGFDDVRLDGWRVHDVANWRPARTENERILGRSPAADVVEAVRPHPRLPGLTVSWRADRTTTLTVRLPAPPAGSSEPTASAPRFLSDEAGGGLFLETARVPVLVWLEAPAVRWSRDGSWWTASFSVGPGSTPVLLVGGAAGGVDGPGRARTWLRRMRAPTPGTPGPALEWTGGAEPIDRLVARAVARAVARLAEAGVPGAERSGFNADGPLRPSETERRLIEVGRWAAGTAAPPSRSDTDPSGPGGLLSAAALDDLVPAYGVHPASDAWRIASVDPESAVEHLARAARPSPPVATGGFAAPRRDASAAPSTVLSSSVGAALALGALVYGLLGVLPDSSVGRLTLAPSVPGDWKRFDARGLRVGSARVDVSYRRESGRHTFSVLQTSGPVPLTLVFRPTLVGVGPAAETHVDDAPADLNRTQEGVRTRIEVQLPLDHERRITVG